jgi:hypothetical protein
MLKRIVLAALITSGAAAAYAQAPSANPQQAATPPAATAPATKSMPAPAASADTRKLIGRNIQNAQNDTIGEIKSIYLNKDGKVDSVMVGVGGFLGVGEREVRLAWSELNVSENGEKVTVNMTKDQLKAKPEYKYSDATWRGQVFNDAGVWKTSDAAKPAPANTQTASNAAPASRAGGDFNAEGNVSGNAFIGASVKNDAKETVGKIEEVFVGPDGSIKTVVVSVGGFLGMGTKNVAVKWSDLKIERDGKDLLVKTSWTKDTLKAMPDYKDDRPAQTKSGG